MEQLLEEEIRRVGQLWLSIFLTKDGEFQVNFRTTAPGYSFRVCHGTDLGETIRAALHASPPADEDGLGDLFG